MSRWLSTLGITIFMGCYIIITYLAFQTEYFDPLALIPSLIGMLFLYMINFEYTAPFFSNPNFIAMDGTISTVIGCDRSKPGMRTYTIATKPWYAPKNALAPTWSFKDFMAKLSGQILITLSDTEAKFTVLPRHTYGAPEGAVIYYGGLDKKPVPSVDKVLLSKIDYMTNLLTIYETMVEQFKAVSSTMAQSSNKEVLEASQQISTLVRDITDAGSTNTYDALYRHSQMNQRNYGGN